MSLRAFQLGAAIRRLMVPAAVVAVLLSAASAASAAQAVPPIDQPGGLDAGSCLPPSATVVAEKPWAQRRLTPERAWPLTTGAGVTVAVVDTGVDASVPQLAGRVLPGVDMWNPKGTGNSDCLGHGTFVAGIIAAAPRTGSGLVGVAPEAVILPVRQSNNRGEGSAEGLARAIRYAADAGVGVINVSLSTFYSTTALVDAVRYAEERDVVVVAAASNEGASGNPVAYPAAYPTVLAVAALDPSGKASTFSASGHHISLAAPGIDIVSTGPRGAGHYVGSGTSYAAPFVSGVAALVRARFPHLTAAQVRERITRTADHPSRILPDEGLGWGVVNPYAAVATEALPGDGAGPVTAIRGADLGPITAAPDDDGSTLLALLAVAVGLTALGVAIAVRVIAPAGRARRWRAAGHAVPRTTIRRQTDD